MDQDAHRPTGRRGSDRKQRPEELIVGRLQESGRAQYQFRPGESESFYLKILTRRGERTIWGKDLERALSQSEIKPTKGDQIGVRRNGREPVTIMAPEGPQQVQKQRWTVEKVQFFADRAKLAHRVRDLQVDVRETVRTHPELASTFLSLRAAEQIAERRIADQKDRERFLTLVREAMVKSIRNGEPLPAVRLKADTRSSSRSAPAVTTELAPQARDGMTR